MGTVTIPEVSSGIKSVQRGTAAVAGNITITAVDITKTITRSFSTSSAGTVSIAGTSVGAASGNIASAAVAAITGTTSGTISGDGGTGTDLYGSATSTSTMNLTAANIASSAITLGAQSLSGGTTNLSVATYGVYLSNSTTLVATGPCQYEVVEYY